MTDLYKLLAEKFTSGNSIEVERITITRKEYEAALAQPEQEPVDIHCPSCLHSFSVVPVAKREWVGLTNEEVQEITKQLVDDAAYCSTHFAIAIEAELRRKNNAV